MKSSVILYDKDENEMRLLLHPFTRERQKKNAEKKTKTHNFKNVDAYFQERRRKQAKTKTQILGELCQLSSGEYYIYIYIYIYGSS